MNGVNLYYQSFFPNPGRGGGGGIVSPYAHKNIIKGGGLKGEEEVLMVLSKLLCIFKSTSDK